MLGRLTRRMTAALAVASLAVIPLADVAQPGSEGSAQAAVAATSTAPPELVGTTYTADFPDPTAVYVGPGSGYLAFSTNLWGWGWIPVLQSWDLETWTPYADALPTIPSWSVNDGVWAPGVAHMADRWVLFPRRQGP